MTNRRTIALSSLFILLAVLSIVIAAEKPLRATLEKTWTAYLEATKSGNEAELGKTMSSFRFVTMKNNLASAKRSLTPDIIKSIAETAPDISTAEFVTLLENGSTAGLVFVRDSEEKDATGKPQVTFIFIKFVREESGWKVDTAMDIGQPKFQDNGKKSEFDASDLPPTCEIDGQVRSAPKPLPVPYASAFLDVYCPGYKTQVMVNGIEQATTINQSHSGLLMGGLQKGSNSVVIVVTEAEKDAPLKTEVTIRRILEDRKMVEVFKFEPKENIVGKHTFDFTIDG